jgi:hypothetical protein
MEVPGLPKSIWAMRQMSLGILMFGILLLTSGCAGQTSGGDGPNPLLYWLATIQDPRTPDPELGLSMAKPFTFSWDPNEGNNIQRENSLISNRFLFVVSADSLSKGRKYRRI